MEVERDQDVDDGERPARMARPGVSEHPEDLNARFAGDVLELRNVRVGHQPSSSMNSAIASTRTPLAAISGAYTTSSAAQTIVPFTSLVIPTTCCSRRVMLSLMRIVLALSGATSRPSRMMNESPTTVQVKSPARSPLIGYVYQMRPMKRPLRTVRMSSSRATGCAPSTTTLEAAVDGCVSNERPPAPS